MPVERADADTGLPRERPHRRLAVGGDEHAGRYREQSVAVAGRVRPAGCGSSTPPKRITLRLRVMVNFRNRSIVRLCFRSLTEGDH